MGLEGRGARDSGWDNRAQGYDSSFLGRVDPIDAVGFLRSIAPGRRLLEMGVGTGRLAVPLAGAGFVIDGIDNSASMLDILANNTAAAGVSDRVQGIFADVGKPGVTGPYDVVLFSHSVLHLLGGQEEQRRAIAAGAAVLAEAGVLVVEAIAPHAFWVAVQPDGAVIRSMTPNEVQLSVTEHDVVAQTVRFREVSFTESGRIGVTNYAVRYVWPSELDLLAELVGLEFAGRRSGWSGAPYTSTALSHVSVYRRAAWAGGESPLQSGHPT